MTNLEKEMKLWQEKNCEDENDAWGCCTFGCLWWLFSLPVAVVVHLMVWLFKKR